MHAVAVPLPGPDPRQVAVPHEPVPLRKVDPRLPAVVDQTELDPLRDLREEGEVGAPAVEGGTQRVRGTGPDVHKTSAAARAQTAPLCWLPTAWSAYTGTDRIMIVWTRCGLPGLPVRRPTCWRAREAGGAVERAEEARALWRGRPFAPWSDEPWAAASLVATRGRDDPAAALGGARTPSPPVPALPPRPTHNWNQLARMLFGCSGTTCWRRLQAWTDAGVWPRLHELLLADLRAAISSTLTSARSTPRTCGR